MNTYTVTNSHFSVKLDDGSEKTVICDMPLKCKVEFTVGSMSGQSNQPRAPHVAKRRRRKWRKVTGPCDYRPYGRRRSVLFEDGCAKYFGCFVLGVV
jgi:hypothetical protein